MSVPDEQPIALRTRQRTRVQPDSFQPTSLRVEGFVPPVVKLDYSAEVEQEGEDIPHTEQSENAKCLKQLEINTQNKVRSIPITYMPLSHWIDSIMSSLFLAGLYAAVVGSSPVGVLAATAGFVIIESHLKFHMRKQLYQEGQNWFKRFNGWIERFDAAITVVLLILVGYLFGPKGAALLTPLTANLLCYLATASKNYLGPKFVPTILYLLLLAVTVFLYFTSPDLGTMGWVGVNVCMFASTFALAYWLKH